jgi:hypothetical protein
MRFVNVAKLILPAIYSVLVCAGDLQSALAEDRAEYPIGESEPICGGVLVEAANLGELRQAIADLNSGMLQPGTVIRISGAHTFPSKAPAVALQDVRASEQCPVVIEGSGVDRMLDGGREPLVNYVAPRVGFPDESWTNCFVVRDSSWIVFRNLRVKDCWPTFLFVDSSSYLTLQHSHISGSTYAVYLRDRTHHVLVEDNQWEQDPSGDVWASIPWGIAHHGSMKHLNGAFVGATSIAGGIIIRRNTLRNAYNAVRLKSADCAETKLCNMNVEIYDNDMEYIRDNPIEIEQHAGNWWVYGNRIRNAHAWFSMDGARGGPHFVFSNVGWFDDIPGRLCRDEDWDDEKEADGAPFQERECQRSRGGKVFKVGNRMERPLYVFHNSWYLRAPAGGGGASGPVRFWNNAIEFCRPVANDETCTTVDPFFKSNDEDRFVWNVDSTKIEHRMSYTISNREGFPRDLRAAGYPVHGFFAERLGFVNPAAGDFRVEQDSPARDRGCLIHPVGQHRLTCAPTSYTWRPDIGAYQGERLYRGPPFTHLDGPAGPDSIYIERPRVIGLSLEALDQGLFSLQFSVPILLSDGLLETDVTLESNDSSPVDVPCMIAVEDRSVMSCDMADVTVRAATLTRVLLPNHIRRLDGAQAPLTLWGNPMTILGIRQ